MYLGGGTLAWVSDYSQIYFVDAGEPVIVGIEDVGDDAFARGFYVAARGFVVYTADCLRQEISVRLFTVPPPESRADDLSGDAWIRTAQIEFVISSRTLAISSPSRGDTAAVGPLFALPSDRLCVRINWLEHDEDRYNALRGKPDVVAVDVWPATAG